MKIYCIFIFFCFAFTGKTHISERNNFTNHRFPADSVELLSHYWNLTAYAVNGNKAPVDKTHPGFVDIKKTGDVIMKRFGNTAAFKWSLLPGKMLWKVMSPEKTEETIEWKIVELNTNSLTASAKVDGADIMLILNR
jgi:hypothetical protein